MTAYIIASQSRMPSAMFSTCKSVTSIKSNWQIVLFFLIPIIYPLFGLVPWGLAHSVTVLFVFLAAEAGTQQTLNFD